LVFSRAQTPRGAHRRRAGEPREERHANGRTTRAEPSRLGRSGASLRDETILALDPNGLRSNSRRAPRLTLAPPLRYRRPGPPAGRERERVTDGEGVSRLGSARARGGSRAHRRALRIAARRDA